MAKQIIVDFKVETGPAVREVQDLKKEIQKVKRRS
jgi:HKD family nuclease